MTNFAIMRIEKIKTVQEGTKRLKHAKKCDTIGQCEPIKPISIVCNENGRENLQNGYNKTFKKHIANQKPRKNAVKGFEVVLTASPGALTPENTKAWSVAAIKWLCQEFKTSNIDFAFLHLHESTPHIHAFVCPIDDRGHLNASHFTGTPQQMRDLQSSYAKSMEPFGLERGISKKITKKRHQTLKEYRAKQANQAEKQELHDAELFAYRSMFPRDSWDISDKLKFAEHENKFIETLHPGNEEQRDTSRQQNNEEAEL